MNINANLRVVVGQSAERQTETYYAVIKNSLKDRIRLFLTLVFEAFSSFGRALGNEKYKSRWSQLFEAESKQQLLTITRLSSKAALIPKISQDDLDKVQAELNERGILLNCAHPPRQEQLNDIIPDAVQKFLDQIHATDQDRYEFAKYFFESGLDKITVGELEEHLPRCAKQLDSQIKNKDYQVGFVKRKSLEWIAELALPHMSHQPSEHFEPSTDVGGHQSPLSQNSSRFAIFDDASYSGKQVKSIIESVRGELVRQNRKGKLYFVIPFISKISEKYLINSLLEGVNAIGSEAHKGSKHIKVHVITSERTVKTMRDVFPDGENDEGVTFTQWKVPDSQSMSNLIRGGGLLGPELITNYPPCYKLT